MFGEMDLSVLEICAGAGGQAIGLEQAGFKHSLAVEIDKDAAATLKLNRPHWEVVGGDVKDLDATKWRGVSLVAGGVPCPPFSVAGKQLGSDDERDLFPEALRVIEEARPDAVMLENVRGLSSQRFAAYREQILSKLTELGYKSQWRLVHAADFGVPQLRPRFVLVALKGKLMDDFTWPSRTKEPPTVGQTLYPLMSSNGWVGAEAWAELASDIGPTLVGGSKKHGGADLGPTRARDSWRKLGVDGRGIADNVPDGSAPHDHIPRLTNDMAARIQGFPFSWRFVGKKTSVYRQIGNAFPPPVAKAIGAEIARILKQSQKSNFGASVGVEATG